MKLLFLVVVLLLLYFGTTKVYEKFFIGISTRNTRNMSYDLRGDPCVIRPNFVSPWGMSSILPQPGYFCN
jgi:hypothetical protein